MSPPCTIAGKGTHDVVDARQVPITEPHFPPMDDLSFMNFGVDVSTLLENLPIVKTAVKSLLIFHFSG